MARVEGSARAASTRSPRHLRTGVRASVVSASLALARLRARPGRGVVAALGILAATALLAGVLGGSTVAGDRTLARAVAHVPAAQRAISVGWFGGPPAGGYAGLDRSARSDLHTLSAERPARTLVFSQLHFGGTLILLGAMDRSSLHLVSGRLPATCGPARCEVVQAGGDPAPRVLREPGLRLVVVGRAQLGVPLPGSSKVGGSPRHAAVLVSGDVRALSGMDALGSLYRVYGWSVPLRPGSVHVWQVDGLLRREASVANSLGRRSDFFGLDAPDQALRQAHADADAASRRMLLVAGEGAALLLAFVLLAGGALRRDVGAEWSRLERRGAGAPSRWLLALIETGWIAVLGVAAGLALGALATVLAARAAGIAAVPVLGASLADPEGALLAAGCLAGALGLLLAMLALPPADVRSRRPTALDVVALGALAAVGLAAARGGTSPSDLAAGRVDPLLPLLPLLASLIAAVVAARALAPTLRLVERAARRGPLVLRMALVSLARDSGRAALTAAFLVVAVGTAVFAAGYRETLLRGERDQAAFRVPLDAVVSEGAGLVRPLDVAALPELRGLTGGGVAAPVLRRSATVPTSGAASVPATVLGLPAPALAHLRWRDDYAAAPPEQLASLIAPRGSPALRGEPLPAGASRVDLLASAGTPLELALVVLRDGRFSTLALGTAARRPRTLHAALPAAARGGRVVALEVALPFAQRLALAHQSAEGGQVQLRRSRISLGTLRADGAVVTSFPDWVGRGGLTPQPASGGVRVAAALGGAETALLRPPQPTDGQEPAAIVSPDLARSAGPGGTLTLDVNGLTLPVRVAAVAERFPTLPNGAAFAVVDGRLLATALDAQQPGTGAPGAVWLGAGDAASRARLERALGRPAFEQLDVRLRERIQRGLERDPLARGIVTTLAVLAPVALALAGLGVLLGLLAALRDERAELFDLEAQGAAPPFLRRELLLRAALLIAFGALGGVLLGVLLGRSVVDLVLVSAGAAAPDPPLAGATSWELAAAGLAVMAAGTLAACLLATRLAFRRSVPRPPGGGAP
jgi:hypothetical protein